ncbi:TSUP family transporter [Thermococcus peptonophilus]|uniref:TSUP family transporter n=1 Tax=Thermococcus peptonophilus TaxID=53952 RepID=UPI0034663803
MKKLEEYSIDDYLTLLLGIILVITATLSLFKGGASHPCKERVEVRLSPRIHYRSDNPVHIGWGGGGVIVSFALMNVARVDPKEVVGGVSLLYGLALSLMGFLNHAAFGSVDYHLALLLTAGTLPGVYLGTHLNSITNGGEKLKKLINVIILVIGIFTVVRSLS